MIKSFKKIFIGALSVFALTVVGCGNSSSSGGGGGSGGVISVTSLTLSEQELNLIPDEEFALEVSYQPENAVGFTIEWSSSDTTVATVRGGTVTAVGSGTAEITAKVKGTEISDTCFVRVADPWHDYVKDGSVKLLLDYKGHNFYEDGIQQVELQTAIDGDTAHFKTGGDILKSRFYGIDTPESTGKVQPYGWEASDFTTTKLNEAKTIVVSSPNLDYGKPSPDSTGSRYVSLIWINLEKENAPYDELYLLNLWVVQEGFSLVRNIDDIPSYEDSFYNAYSQAVAYKKNMHSGKPAEHYNYNEGYLDVSLLDIKREIEKTFVDPNHVNPYDNEKVRFTGVVSSYNDNVLYVQEFYPTLDEDGNEMVDDQGNIIGEWAGINIFCGMQTISSRFTKPNTYIQVYGLCKDSKNFGFQVTDTQGKWATFAPGEEDCRVLLKAEENTEEHKLKTFEYTIKQLDTVADAKNCESLFCSVKVDGELTVSSVYVSDDRALTIRFKETRSWNVYIPFAYYNPDDDADRWDTEDEFINKKFKIEAGTYAWHKTTSGNINFQVIPTNQNSFVLVK